MQGNYEGGMPLEAARKDSVLALELAQSLQVPLFANQAAHTAYDIALRSCKVVPSAHVVNTTLPNC
ncbi:hypothetical protein [Pollutimonas nitritireducens]|uniref:hypothetical protein n=1 Tax=Pollutimonas nitritireducens TaxID=2045209 RepID=UPI0018EC1BA2|nr:hypothetical protein [Pollutimonas nitritireducens]